MIVRNQSPDRTGHRTVGETTQVLNGLWRTEGRQSGHIRFTPEDYVLDLPFFTLSTSRGRFSCEPGDPLPSVRITFRPDDHPVIVVAQITIARNWMALALDGQILALRKDGPAPEPADRETEAGQFPFSGYYNDEEPYRDGYIDIYRDGYIDEEA